MSVSWFLLLCIGIIAVTMEQFTHLTQPDSLSKKARPPLIEHMDISERLDPQQFRTDQDFISAFLAMNLGPIKGGTFLTDRAFPVGFVRMKPEWDERIFRLTTVARNGAFEQVTTLRKGKSGRWYMARVKVTKEKPKGEGKEVLNEEEPNK